MDVIIGSAIFVVLLVILSFIAVWLLEENRTQKTTLIVRKGDDVVGGIPFYIKRGRRIHQTTYLETLIRLTLSIEKNNKS